MVSILGGGEEDPGSWVPSPQVVQGLGHGEEKEMALSLARPEEEELVSPSTKREQALKCRMSSAPQESLPLPRRSE